MANGTDNPFACSVLNIVSLNTGLASLKVDVEFEAFDWNSDAAESFHVLALRTDNDDEGTGSVIVELVEIADASEAEAGVGVEGVAG